MILVAGYRFGRAILSHAGCRFPAALCASERHDAVSWVSAPGDIPIADRFMVHGKTEHGFERDMPVKAAVVAEDKFIEVGIDMLATQAVIRAQAPPLQQREDPVNPWQHDMARHLADRARIVSVVA